MSVNQSFRNLLRSLMWPVAFLVLVIVLSNYSVLAQQTQQPSNVDVRIRALEKTVDELRTLIIVIPSGAALVVVILQIVAAAAERKIVRTRDSHEVRLANSMMELLRARDSQEAQIKSSVFQLTKMRDEHEANVTSFMRELANKKESREAESAARVDEVMSSVNQILSFQAKRAEKEKELLDKFDPGRGIQVLLDKVSDLRKEGHLSRHNLHQYHFELVDLSNRMKNMEELYNLSDFKDSINCHHIRGLAAHLENRFQEAENHLRAVSEKIAEGKAIKQKDEYIEPISLYYRGVLLKNIDEFDGAIECFGKALEKWPRNNREVLTWVELAEVVAFKSSYDLNDKKTQNALNEIERVLQDHDAGIHVLTDDQKSNLQSLKGRVFLIDGNYAYHHKDWEEALKYYEQMLELNKNSIFGNLSVGLALLRKGATEQAKSDLMGTYKLMVSSDALVTHPEPRGRILLIGSALIAGRLCGANDAELRQLRDPNQLHVDLVREIEDLRRINIRAKRQFSIFSPLSKKPCSLKDFRYHTEHPEEILKEIGSHSFQSHS